MLLTGAKSGIVVDPKVVGGKPVIRGTRMLVYFIYYYPMGRVWIIYKRVSKPNKG